MTATERIAKDAVLLQYSDVELWFAEDTAQTWRLPLWVYWLKDKATEVHYARVVPAIVPYVSQSLTLRALLEPHDHGNLKTEWLIYRKIAEVILRKAPGVTPTFYYRWDDPHPIPPIQVTHPNKLYQDVIQEPERSGFEGFASHIAITYKIEVALVRLVMKAISDEAVGWMLEKRMALDLGFAKLIAAPYRPNWKEIVVAKTKSWSLLEMFNMLRGDERTKCLTDAGIPQLLCSTDNIALSARNHRILYSLEAIPSKKFDAAVRECETQRQTAGPSSYVAHYETTIEALYEDLIEALATYLRKICAPFATVLDRTKGGVVRLTPTKRRQDLYNLPTHIVLPTSPFSVLGEDSSKTVVRPKAAPLQPLPIVQQIPRDLRDSDEQRTLGGQGNGSA